MKKVMRDLVIYWSILFLIALIMLATASMGRAENVKKIIDTEFVTVSSYLVLMTIFDVETTFSAIRNGAGEANLIMKPFTKNRAYMYGVQFGVDALVIWLAYKMKESSHFGKVWWIAPSIVGTAHGVAGGLNLRYCW